MDIVSALRDQLGSIEADTERAEGEAHGHGRRTGAPAHRRTGAPAHRRTGAPAQCGCAGRHVQLGIDIWHPSEDDAEQLVIDVEVDEGVGPEHSLDALIPRLPGVVSGHGIGEDKIEADLHDTQPSISATLRPGDWRPRLAEAPAT